MVNDGVVAVSVAEYDAAELRAKTFGGTIAVAVAERDWKVVVVRACGLPSEEFHGDTPDEAVDHAISGLGQEDSVQQS